jgi:hypothetical protein
MQLRRDATAMGRHGTTSTVVLATAAGLALATAAGLAQAASLEALSEGAPITLDDAETVGIKSLQLNVPADFSRLDSGDNQVRLTPELEYGLAQDVQVALGVPLLFGSADRTGSGNLRTAAKWKFLSEYGWRPALAAEVVVVAPTGRDSDGVDTALKVLATKSLGGRVSHRMHANLIVEHNADAAPAERTHRRAAVIGYDRRVTPDLMVVADLVYAHGRERGEADRLVEVGARYRVASDVLGFGLGRGLGSSQTDWRLLVSYQHSF